MSIKGNKIKVRLLKAARALIKSSEQVRVCFALSTAYAYSDMRSAVNYDALCELKYLINIRLNGKIYLENWLNKTHRIRVSTHWSLQSIDQREKLRITRLAWIDDLIKEFS